MPDHATPDEDPLPPAVVDSPAILRGHTDDIKDLAFSPDGTTLASGDAHGAVRLWDMRTHQSSGTLSDVKNRAVMSLAFSPDGATLATAAGSVTLWDLASTTVTATLRTQTPVDSVWSVAYGPNNLLATGNCHGRVLLWNPRHRKVVRTLHHPGTPFAVAISPDGTTLASGGTNNTDVLVWNTRNGKRRHVLTGHTTTIRALAFSPDGRTLASASYDRTIRLWDLRTGRNTATLTGHTSVIMAVAFHPWGTILASGAATISIPPSGPNYPEDNSVRLWNAHTAQPIATLTGHTGTVSCVAFHPNGRILASGSFDTTIRLWPINLLGS